MNKYFWILLVLILPACQSTSSSESVDSKTGINIFNDISIRLLDSEKTVELESEIQDAYFKHISKKEIQIPLFRCIKKDDYTLYIGIPFRASVKNISSSPTTENTLLNSHTDSVSFDYKSYQIDTVYIAEYTQKINESIIYMLSETSSKKIQETLFSEEALSNRISSTNEN